MYVACSTQCFNRLPLAEALQLMTDLDFSRVDVAITPNGPHVTPEHVEADMANVARRLKRGPALTPGAFNIEFNAADSEAYKRQFRAICRLARACAVRTLTIPAAPVGGDIGQERERLQELVGICTAEGLVLTVETRIGTVTETPKAAVDLCEKVDGLGLTLDPSHFVCGPHQNGPFDEVYPYVRHVHLRDTGLTPERMQVLIGQGEIEYSRIITQLDRHGYDRLLTVEILDIPDSPFVMESEVRKLKFLLESLV